jgi:hypothetical protein
VETVEAILDWMSEHPVLCAALFLVLLFGGFSLAFHIGIDIR